ncbi:DUF695 domain-containing protein [Desulfovibrio sp. OttesenSCG-928-A18]|nr:DUF695 domain-containing protein [Desulfovibrio sp. OttesenSCG-928-A18]
MTDNWDSYLCEVDDKPASMLVDLGAWDLAPRPDYPLMAYVSLKLTDPDEYGFPKTDEYDSLAGLEDALDAALTREDGAHYVGRCITDGHLDMFFYVRVDFAWRKELEEVMRPYAAYPWECGVREDPDWDVYLDFLFPDNYALLTIQNRRVCRHLQELGDDPSRSHMVEHWADFPSQDAALGFMQAARSRGYSVAPSGPALVPNADQAAPDSDGHAKDEAGAEADTDAGPILAEGGARFQNIGLYPEQGAGLEPAPDEQQDAEAAADTDRRPENAFQVCIAAPGIPEELDEETFALAELCLEYAGSYRGWSCAAFAQDDAEPACPDSPSSDPDRQNK